MARFTLTKLSIWSFGGLPIASQGQACSEKKPRGFVLSFSTFALAIFLVVFAQLQYSHLLNMQLDASDIHQTSTPARVMRDIALDFNTLTGQTLTIDQNRDQARITISGRRPNPISLDTSLLRYQSGLFRFGRDTNTSIFLDFNQTFSDRNFWGRTNNGLQWRDGIDNNRFRIFMPDINFPAAAQSQLPIFIDINIISEVPYTSIITGELGGSFHLPNIYVLYSINYSDTNADHNISHQGTAVNVGGYFIYAGYDVNGTTQYKEGTIGNYEAVNETRDDRWFSTAIAGAPSVPWRYSITYTMPNDINGTRAGYDVNAILRGKDMNVDTNTIWTYGG